MTNDRRPFADRVEAGRELGRRLAHLKGRDAVVLALPRGGVPVARQVADALDAPLDIFVVRKLGTPWHRELAMGAIASGGIRVLNDEVIRWYRLTPDTIESVVQVEQAELVRREQLYREGRPAVPLKGRTVIIVDDGLATGSTMLAAIQAVRRTHAPQRVVVAVPVGARETCQTLEGEADEVVCLRTPEPFSAVGQWYLDFDQTTDDEVRALLRMGTGVATPP